jgi:hypothetical protein
MFSKKPETSHMIHCDMPLILSESPMTTAIEPTETMPVSQKPIDIAETANTRTELLK